MLMFRLGYGSREMNMLRVGTGGRSESLESILVAVFPVLMLSSPIPPVSSCRSPLGTITAGE
jgi:hypothetical protein